MMQAGSVVTPLAAPKGIKMVCELCQKPALLLCTGCRCAYYCTEEHQKTAWASVHSKVCPLVGALGKKREFCTLQQRRALDIQLRTQKLEVLRLSLLCGTRHIYNRRPALTLPAAKQALAIAAEVHGASSVELLPAYLLLAAACVQLGELDSAECYLSQAEWTLIYAERHDHHLRALLFRGWAQLLAARRDWVQAKWCCSEDVHHCSEAFGPEDVRCTVAYYRLAEAFLHLEKYDIVASIYRQVVSIWNSYFYSALSKADCRVHRQLDDLEVIEAVHVLSTIQRTFQPPPPTQAEPADAEPAPAPTSAASSGKQKQDFRQWWRNDENAECVAQLELILSKLRTYSPGLELPADSPPGTPVASPTTSATKR